MNLRGVARRLGVLVAAALLLGALSALAWAGLSVLPTYVVQADGHATLSQVGLADVVSSDWWFSVLAFVGGLGLGVGAWVALRRVGWPVAVVAAGVALLAGATCWLVGELVGPGDFAERIAAALPGDVVPIALRLHSPSALALWPFAAVSVPLFAASLGPEASGEPKPLRRRRSRPEADEAETLVAVE